MFRPDSLARLRTAAQHTGGEKKGGVIKIKTFPQPRQHFHRNPCRSGRLFAGRQHKTLLRGVNISRETGDGRKSSAGLGGTDAARRCGSGFGWRRRVSDGGAKLSGGGRPAGRTGPDSHFSHHLIILLSTNGGGGAVGGGVLCTHCCCCSPHPPTHPPTPQQSDIQEKSCK